MAIVFQVPRFYPILDSAALSSRGIPALSAADALIDAGVRILQYRHKDAWAQSHFDEAKRIAERCQDAGVLFVLNDRADFAKLLRVALHVGQDDLSPVAARSIIGDEVMGFSTHNKRQLENGNLEPVEYLSIGPIFATTSKLKPDPVVGLERLTSLKKLTQKPVVAIGGITMANALETLKAGADAVAVISGLLPERTDRKALRRRAEEWLQLVAVDAKS